MIFRKVARFKNHWIDAIYITGVGFAAYLAFRGMSFLLSSNSNNSIFLLLAIVLFLLYFIFAGIIFQKYEIRENELFLRDINMPFGKKIPFKDINTIEAKELGKKEEKAGTVILTFKEKKIALFPDKQKTFITELKKRNENIVIE